MSAKAENCKAKNRHELKQSPTEEEQGTADDHESEACRASQETLST